MVNTQTNQNNYTFLSFLVEGGVMSGKDALDCIESIRSILNNFLITKLRKLGENYDPSDFTYSLIIDKSSRGEWLFHRKDFTEVFLPRPSEYYKIPHWTKIIEHYFDVNNSNIEEQADFIYEGLQTLFTLKDKNIENNISLICFVTNEGEFISVSKPEIFYNQFISEEILNKFKQNS